MRRKPFFSFEGTISNNSFPKSPFYLAGT